MKEPTQKLIIKFGDKFEISADGRFAIIALLIAVFGYLSGATFGLWGFIK